MPKEQPAPSQCGTTPNNNNVKRLSSSAANSKASRQQSEVSVDSIGIGKMMMQKVKQVSKSTISQSSRTLSGLMKLRPNGNHAPNKVVYDCVVYLIYCSTHNRFAVTSSGGGETLAPVWLPFVARHGRTWLNATSEGLLTLFERSQCSDEKYKDETEVLRVLDFEYNVRCMELFRLEVAEKFWVKRMTQFVSITKCQQTCQPINNIRWLEASDLIEKCCLFMWGPEFAIYYNSYLLKSRYLDIVVNEHPIKQIMNFINDANEPSTKSSRSRSNKATTNHKHQHHHDSSGLLSSLIQSAEITAEKLRDLYEDYLSHTFPSYYMTITSFRVYLRKCGLNLEEDSYVVNSLFNCCLAGRTTQSQAKSSDPTVNHSTSYMDFLDICYLMVATDPTTPHQSNRLRFVFSYYDKNGDGVINSNEIQMMLGDISSLSNGKIAITPITSTRLTFQDMEREVAAGRFVGTELLCRWPYSVFAKLETIRTIRTSNGSGTMIADDNSTTIHSHIRSGFSNTRSRADQVYCPRCQLKTFEYGQHYITLNSNGRCVEPTLIPDTSETQNQQVKPAGKYHYSLEYVFHTASYGNVLFDYIRDKKFDATAKSDEKNLCEYFRLLCSSVAELFKNEPKLIKRQSPTLVIGNINGNLDSLFSIQNKFWVNMPIISDNICFLGNYSGGVVDSSGKITSPVSQYSLEVIIYLFSMKYINPNKVILLRGIQETRQYNQRTLLEECQKRYDDQLGRQIWESINSVFDHLPYVAIVDESIVCTSSGIPKDSVKSKFQHLFDNYSHHSNSTKVDTTTINVAAAAVTGNNDSVSSGSISSSQASTPTTINDQCSIFQQIMTNIPEIRVTNATGAPLSANSSSNRSNSSNSSSSNASSSSKTTMQPSRSAQNNKNRNKKLPAAATAAAAVPAPAPNPINSSLFRPNPAHPNSFTFTYEAFKQFMSLNQFRFMIRGNHQKQVSTQRAMAHRAAPQSNPANNPQQSAGSNTNVATSSSSSRQQKRRTNKSNSSNASSASRNSVPGDTVDGDGYRIQFNRSCISIANNATSSNISDYPSPVITVAFITHPNTKVQLIQFENNDKTTNTTNNTAGMSTTTISSMSTQTHHHYHQRHHRLE